MTLGCLRDDVVGGFGPDERLASFVPAVGEGLDRVRSVDLIETMTLLAATHIAGPHIDWAALSPILALSVGPPILAASEESPPESGLAGKTAGPTNANSTRSYRNA